MGIQINGQTEIISSSDKSITLDDSLTLKNLTVTGTLTGPSVVPVGAVFHFAASSAPAGYLKCNGDVVPNGSGTVQGVTANFSALYNILGTTYGSLGKLPDLRGEFVRGWADDKVGIDTQTTFGRVQGDAMQGHVHNFRAMAGDATLGANPGGNIFGGATLATTSPLADSTNGTPRTAAETRPRNVALLACIKY